jgi:DNA-binding transcriptional LysR family regulator
LYPDVHLQLRTGLSCNLLLAYDEGELDAVIAKRDGAAQRGRVIWREPLTWMVAEDCPIDDAKPVPLVLLPAPCTYRETMIRSLASVRRDWFIACSASSLMGIQAAVAGGLGVTVLGRSFVQPGLRILPPSDAWPALPTTEIVMIGEDKAPIDLIRSLVSFLTDSLSVATPLIRRSA